jgi:hypothetical protein
MAKKEKPYTVETIARGKRKFGEVRRLPDGRSAYFAYRRMKDMFRGGEKTYSDALRTQKACWGFDVEILMMLKKKDVIAIGVLVKDTGDTYLTSAETITDPRKSRLVHRGHVAMRHVPVHLFSHTPGKIRV